MKLSALLSLVGLVATASAAPVKRGLPRLGGINLAGCDFGMSIWGWSGTSYCPGTEQISHFVNQGANVVRLPVGWQYLVGNDQSSKSLDASFFATYDKLVKAVTATGAYAIIDLHNYGRWNSGVIGVDGPSNEAFASLWSLLATKYANNPLVMFGLMNEPHDLDISKFAVSCQAAVNAIRAAGAKSQTIVLPGNSWDNAGVWASGANAPMLAITDPASSDKSALILDVHKYFDSDGSGSSTTCTNNGLDLLQPLVAYLKANGRKAILSEIGGAPTPSCLTYVPQAMQYLVDNADVIAGFTTWSAGAFQPYPGYELSIVPNADGSDNEFFKKAVLPYLPGVKSGPATTPPASSTSIKPPTTATPSSTKPSTSTVAPSLAKPSTSTAVPSSAKPTTTSAPTSAKPTTSSASPSSSVKPSTSSAAPVTTPKTSTVVVPPSSSATPKPTITPTSSATIKPSSIAPPISSTTPTAPTAGNLQTFRSALGGYAAPAVTKSGNSWYIGEQRYNFLIDALNQSCYKQMDACQNAANAGGNAAPLTVANCNGQQIQACLANAAASA